MRLDFRLLRRIKAASAEILLLLDSLAKPCPALFSLRTPALDSNHGYSHFKPSEIDAIDGMHDWLVWKRVRWILTVQLPLELSG